MPNWCRGNLVVRGTKDNVRRFLLENLSVNHSKIHEDNEKLIICSKKRIFINGTYFDFIADDIEFNFATEESIKQCTMYQFMAANYVKPEPYTQMSRKYDIDIYLFVIEIDGGFVQEIEIQKGEIVNKKLEDIKSNYIPIDKRVIDDFDDIPF